MGNFSLMCMSVFDIDDQQYVQLEGFSGDSAGSHAGTFLASYSWAAAGSSALTRGQEAASYLEGGRRDSAPCRRSPSLT